MHVPAGGLSPIHFLQAPSTELLTTLQDDPQKSMHAAPPPPSQTGEQTPPASLEPLVLCY